MLDDGPLADYFDAAVAASKNPQQSLNFVLGDLSRLANETGTAVNASKVTPALLAELIGLLDAKTINSKIAKDVIERTWQSGESPKAIVEREGLAQTSDSGAIEKFVDDVLAANPKVVEEYRAGKTGVAGFLVGQVMKASQGKANPAMVQDLVKKKLG